MPKITAKVFPQFYASELQMCPCGHEWTAPPDSVELDWVEVAGDVAWFAMREWHCPKCNIEIRQGEMVDESPLP